MRRAGVDAVGDDCAESADASASSARFERPCSSAPESSAPASEVCAARDELADSVAALGDVSISDLTSGGMTAITDALGDVREDLGAVGSAAGAELRSQVQDVEDAIDELETAVDAIGDGGSVRVAVAALGDVVTTAGTLLHVVGDALPDVDVRVRSPPRRPPADQRRRLPAATMAANSSSVSGNTDSRLPLASRRDSASSGIARSSSRGT